MAVGGYGRGEMAPHSDVDVAFITPNRRAPWCEQVIETMLYLLWDLGLKVGQSVRTVTESTNYAKDAFGHTIDCDNDSRNGSNGA